MEMNGTDKATMNIVEDTETTVEQAFDGHCEEEQATVKVPPKNKRDAYANAKKRFSLTSTKILELQKYRNRNAARDRSILFALVSLCTCFYVGAPLGWGPMQLILENHGSYSKECSAEERAEGIICDDQTAKLVKIGFLFPCVQILAPLYGLFVDKFGATKTAYFQGSLAVVGLTIVVLATQTNTDFLLYCGFVLMGCHTWFGPLLIIQLGLYFTGINIPRTIFLLNVFFDSASVTYLVLKWIQELVGATAPALLLGYAVVALFLYGTSCYYWTVSRPEKLDEAVEELNVLMDRSMHMKRFRFAGSSSGPALSVSSPDFYDEISTRRLSFAISTRKFSNVEPTTVGEESMKHGEKTLVTKQSTQLTTIDCEREEKYILVSERSRNDQLRSTAFVLLCGLFGIHVCMSNWNMISQRDFLASLGDDEEDNLYLTIFTLMSPVSIVGAPVVDRLVLHYGWHVAFQMVNILGFAYMLIKVASEDLNVQIIAAIIFSFYRSFLFGLTFSYLATLVNGKVVGVAAGVLQFLAGAASLPLMALVNIAVKKNDGEEGAFLLPNSIMMGLLIPSTLLTCRLGREMALERTEKGRQLEQLGNE